MIKYHGFGIAVLLLAAVLLVGCAVPAASVSQPGQGGTPAALQGQPSTSVPTENPLNDGKLRYHPAAQTVFCGSTPIYTKPAHETINLLTDWVTGQTNYFLLGCPEGSDQYRYTLRDKTGAVVRDLGGSSTYTICDGWLRLITEQDEYGGTAASALLQLSTGKMVQLPRGGTSLSSPWQGLLCVDWFDYNKGEFELLLYDTTGELLQTLPDWNSDGSAAIPGWLPVRTSNYDRMLYNPETGETIGDYYDFCGKELICVDGGRRVISLQSREEVFRSKTQCIALLEDGAVVLADPNRQDRQFAYDFIDAAGQSVPVDCSYWNDSGYCALRTADTVRLYKDGALLFEQPYSFDVQLDADTYSYMQILAEQQLVLLNISTYYEDDFVEWYQLFGAGDTSWNAPIRGYDHITLDDNAGYGYGFNYENNTGGGYRMDIIDLQGNVLIKNVANVSACEPEFFACRRGFEYGWMDLAGNWLWSTSIWQSPTEDQIELYW